MEDTMMGKGENVYKVGVNYELNDIQKELFEKYSLEYEYA